MRFLKGILMTLMTLAVIATAMGLTTIASEAKTVHVAGKNTNASKKSWGKLSKAKLQKQYKKHKVFVKDVKIGHWAGDKNSTKYVLSWDEAPGAKGYQIVVKSSVGTIKQTVSVTELLYSAPLADTNSVTLKVRPYTKINGKKVYGKWSGTYGIK